VIIRVRRQRGSVTADAVVKVRDSSTAGGEDDLLDMAGARP